MAPQTARAVHPWQGSRPAERTGERESTVAGAGATGQTTTQDAVARPILPELGDTFTRRVAAETLASIRTQVEPWEIVAIYRKESDIRIRICGPQRELVAPVRTLPDGWVRIAATLITDDGEVPLSRVHGC